MSSSEVAGAGSCGEMVMREARIHDEEAAALEAMTAPDTLAYALAHCRNVDELTALGYCVSSALFGGNTFLQDANPGSPDRPERIEVQTVFQDGGAVFLLYFDTFTLRAKYLDMRSIQQPNWRLMRPGRSGIGPPTTVAVSFHSYKNEDGDPHNLFGSCFYSTGGVGAHMCINDQDYDTYDEYIKDATAIIAADPSLAQLPGSKTKAARA